MTCWSTHSFLALIFPRTITVIEVFGLLAPPPGAAPGAGFGRGAVGVAVVGCVAAGGAGAPGAAPGAAAAGAFGGAPPPRPGSRPAAAAAAAEGGAVLFGPGSA